MSTYIEKLRNWESQPSKGELCYLARKSGAKWKDIDTACGGNGIQLAQSWAKHQKPPAEWPIVFGAVDASAASSSQSVAGSSRVPASSPESSSRVVDRGDTIIELTED